MTGAAGNFKNWAPQSDWLTVLETLQKPASDCSKILSNRTMSLTTSQTLLQLIKPSVLVTTVGSGPFGERTPESHIYTLGGSLPESLRSFSTAAPTSLPQRNDIDIGSGGLAFTISNVMSAEQCDALAAISESVGYSRFAPAITTPPGMRQNSAAHWISSDQHASEFLDPMYDRLAHLLPPLVSGGKVHNRLSRRMAHYKYDAGDVFNPHTDGEWPGQYIHYEEEETDGFSDFEALRRPAGISEWPGVVSKLSMLLYLNDLEADGVASGLNPLVVHVGHLCAREASASVTRA